MFEELRLVTLMAFNPRGESSVPDSHGWMVRSTLASKGGCVIPDIAGIGLDGLPSICQKSGVGK